MNMDTDVQDDRLDDAVHCPSTGGHVDAVRPPWHWTLARQETVHMCVCVRVWRGKIAPVQ